jgi:altronate hydrolase
MSTMAEKPSHTIRLNAADNVIVARVDLAQGTYLPDAGVPCRQAVASGHKVATAPIKAGEIVRKYGQIIGVASRDISAGDHVHTHNLSMGAFSRDYAVGEDVRPLRPLASEPAFFQGIVRPDGRVATRNYIGVISTVNCSASVTRLIADEFRGAGALGEFPNVDGIVPICHSLGCGMADRGRGFDHLLDSLAGYARHPNFAGVLLIGLGCEVMQVDVKANAIGQGAYAPFQTMTIQDRGGTRRTVQEAVARIREMLPTADRYRREPVAASHLILGLECGGSDSLSGITANPALGVAADRLVAQGGTAILGETPEIYGAEHLLTRRAVSREVAEKLLARIRWWEDYTAKFGGQMDNNPSPGNKAGGLTTILEKSLGAVAKGGSSNLTEVYRYAEPVRSRGFVFMDTPGYDPVSVTGFVAGGANIVCFTTGRGSVFGCRPVPSIKLATNTPMFERMEEDMDINCGTIADGAASVEEIGKQVFRRILEVASGSKTKSELLGMGNDEFAPWHVGAVM